MGYYTDYTIIVDVDEDTFKETSDKVGGSYLSYGLDYWNGRWSIRGKWYDHEQDLRLLSSYLEGKLITVEGEGEEGQDLWIEYYLDGKMQREEAVITFGDFDPSKLT